MNKNTEAHLTFAKVAVMECEGAVAEMARDGRVLRIPHYYKTKALCDALTWLKVAKHNLAEAEKSYPRRTLKPRRTPALISAA